LPDYKANDLVFIEVLRREDLGNRQQAPDQQLKREAGRLSLGHSKSSGA
jgi:hypothetical protein